MKICILCFEFSSHVIVSVFFKYIYIINNFVIRLVYNLFFLSAISRYFCLVLFLIVVSITVEVMIYIIFLYEDFLYLFYTVHLTLYHLLSERSLCNILNLFREGVYLWSRKKSETFEFWDIRRIQPTRFLLKHNLIKYN